jgi:hypothetical protein
MSPGAAGIGSGVAGAGTGLVDSPLAPLGSVAWLGATAWFAAIGSPERIPSLGSVASLAASGWFAAGGSLLGWFGGVAVFCSI